MYAVVDNGGKQYRVEPGRTLVVDRMDAEAGATVTFERVLLIDDEEQVTVGTPTISGASVRATVVAHGRGPKVIVFKFRPKAHYRRRTGQRAGLTRLMIEEIATGREAPVKRAATRPRAAKPLAAKADAKASARPAAKPRASRRTPATEEGT